MNSIRNILFALFFIVSSCNVLDQDPQDKIDTSQAFSSEANAQKALNGLYNELQSIYDWRIQIIGDLPSDIVQSVDTWDAYINIDEYRTTQSNSEIEDLYTVLYRSIDIANNIIAEVPKLNLAIEKENDFLGQALCIRGLMYFELSRIWGGVPGVYGELGVIIRTTPLKEISEDSYGHRASLEESYEQVKADLTASQELLPDTRGSNDLDRGRVVKSTARALLARLYLYLKDYSNAETAATQVIDDKRYQLVKPFDMIFKSKNTTESIFEMQYGTTDGSGLRHWYLPSSLGGRGGLALHDEFYNELMQNPADDRAKLVSKNPSLNVHYPTKYILAGNADNTHIIRLAELYLIRAEARMYLDNLNGAKTDLNAVRRRSSLGDSPASSKDELIISISKERKIEFFQEGHRWFDLVRTGKTLEALKNLKRRTGSQPVSLNEEGRQVFPFPASEINSNRNLQQNDAYK